jgi:hypothetical protein
VPSWFYRLRDVVWIAVFAFLLAVATPIVAFLLPDALTLVVGLGLSAITIALLAQRV